MNLSISDGKEYVRRKLERDYNKLSPRTRELLKDRYKNIVDVLFVNQNIQIKNQKITIMLKEYIVWKFNKILAIYFFNTILNKFFTNFVKKIEYI